MSLGGADDECAAGGFYDVFGDGVEVVDAQDAIDLGEEAVEKSEVAAGDPGDCGDGLVIGEVVGVEFFSKAFPLALQDEEEFVVGELAVLVGEADAAVELGVVAELFFQSGHAD